MKKILIVLGILVVLLVVAVVGVVVYVSVQLNSESMRQQIVAGLKEATGAQIQIERHRISLLGEAVVEGLAVANAEPDAASNLVKMDRFAAKVRVLSLFSGRTVVERVELSGVEVTVLQTKEGEISLPFKKGDRGATGSEGEAGTEAAQLSADVEQIQVRQLQVTVLDAEREKLLAIRDLSADGRAAVDAGVPTASLKARLGELQVMPGLMATNVRTPVELAGGKARLTKIEADFCGGKAEGEAEADLRGAGRSFAARLQVAEARMEGVMKDIGGDPKTLTGALKLDFQGKGSLDAPKDLTGGGTFRIDQPVVGKLNNPMLPAGLVGVPALQTGKFDAIEGTYKIEGQQVVVEEIKVLSPGLRVGLQGTVGFDKSLDMRGRLFVDANPVTKAADVAQGFMRGLLGGKKEEAGGEPASSDVLKGGVPFTVRGTTVNPVVRPVGPDPLNLVALISKALGFKTEEPGAAAPAPAGAEGSMEAVPTVEPAAVPAASP